MKTHLSDDSTYNLIESSLNRNKCVCVCCFAWFLALKNCFVTVVERGEERLDLLPSEKMI